MRRSLLFLLLLSLASCQVNHLLNSEGKEPIELKQNNNKDSTLSVIIRPYQNELKSKMDSIIGFANHSFERKRPESDLGNFVADLTFKYGLSELIESEKVSGNSNVFSLLNTGGLRSIISEGDITIGDCYTLMPFNNEIVVLKISGEKVEDLVDYLEKSGGEPVSNINVKYTKYSQKDKKYECSIGNVAFDKTKDYYVITSDYLAKGGDKMNFFLEPKEFIQTGKLLRDAIIDEVKSTEGSIKGEVEGRLKFVKDE